MKLKIYQINAILNETIARIESIRDSKKKDLKLDSEGKNLIKIKKEYDKLKKEKDDILDKMNSLSNEFKSRSNIEYYFSPLDMPLEDIEDRIKDLMIIKKYGPMPNSDEIERKLIIKDLGSDFNTEDFIKEMLKQYD